MKALACSCLAALALALTALLLAQSHRFGHRLRTPPPEAATKVITKPCGGLHPSSCPCVRCCQTFPAPLQRWPWPLELVRPYWQRSCRFVRKRFKLLTRHSSRHATSLYQHFASLLERWYILQGACLQFVYQCGLDLMWVFQHMYQHLGNCIDDIVETVSWFWYTYGWLIAANVVFQCHYMLNMRIHPDPNNDDVLNNHGDWIRYKFQRIFKWALRFYTIFCHKRCRKFVFGFVWALLDLLPGAFARRLLNSDNLEALTWLLDTWGWLISAHTVTYIASRFTSAYITKFWIRRRTHPHSRNHGNSVNDFLVARILRMLEIGLLIYTWLYHGEWSGIVFGLWYVYSLWRR